MRLAELQHIFWRSVRFDPAPPEVDDVFVSRGDFSGRDRLALYRRMYWYRQVDALYDTFPVLAECLGEEAFSKLASSYIAAHPSVHHALEHLGERLPSFMRARGDAFAFAGDAVWADLAELEWAQCAALLAPTPPSIASLGDLPFDRFACARLTLVPSLVTCSVRPRALTILRARDREALTAECSSDWRTVIVWRPDFHTRERLLEGDEASALALARTGATLDEICLAFEHAANPMERAVHALTRWIADALVVRATLEGDRS